MEKLKGEHHVAGQHAIFSDQTPLYCISPTHRLLEAIVEKLLRERNACVLSLLLGFHVFIFPQLKQLFRVFPTHRRLEARVEKLKGERNACGKSLVNMQRTLAENARHVDQVCVCVDSDAITESAKKHHSKKKRSRSAWGVCAG